MFCRLNYRVPFSETDAMGIVHHSNHARYFERGRVEFLRLVGFNYLEMTKRGIHVPLTEMQCKFFQPLIFDDILLIETRIASITKARLTFSYKIFRQEKIEHVTMSTEPFVGRVLVEAHTEHCIVNDKGRPQKMENEMFLQLQKISSGEKT